MVSIAHKHLDLRTCRDLDHQTRAVRVTHRQVHLPPTLTVQTLGIPHNTSIDHEYSISIERRSIQKSGGDTDLLLFTGRDGGGGLYRRSASQLLQDHTDALPALQASKGCHSRRACQRCEHVRDTRPCLRPRRIPDRSLTGSGSSVDREWTSTAATPSRDESAFNARRHRPRKSSQLLTVLTSAAMRVDKVTGVKRGLPLGSLRRG
jgi:hypothetical protein